MPACLPIASGSLFGWVTSAAHAESGKGKDGSGDRDDSDSDGSGSTGDDHDDHDDDSAEGHDTGEHDTGSQNGSADTALPSTSTPTSRTPASVGHKADRVTATLHLRYSNGWDERVAAGRYRLTDPKGRVVKDRVARPEDLVRMRAQLGS